MKKLLTVSNGEHLAARTLKTALAALTAFALATTFWVGSMPLLQAQNMSPAQMLQSSLPSGTSMESASKADFLAAVSAAVKAHRAAAAAIVRFATEAHPDWATDILEASFTALRSGGAGGGATCAQLKKVLASAIAGAPASANALTEKAAKLAPECFGTEPPPQEDDANFNAPPGNLNPPPGSIGGGGGQGNVVAVCFNGVTRFFSPQGAQEFLRANPGARLGACVVTPVTNR